MAEAKHPVFDNILITGAAGALGSVLRDSLRPYAKRLTLGDRESMGEPRENEVHHVCDLADRDAVFEMVKGADVVFHLGGAPREDTWQVVLDSNIAGSYNVYEAARLSGVKRIIYASSNHAIGFYETTHNIDSNVPQRPDSLYGVSKTFVENLSRYYYDKFGIESVCMRIGSCFPKPVDRRMLSTWLSYDDLSRLCIRALVTTNVGHTIVYGQSRNSASYWDNTGAAYLGYHPQDSADAYSAEIYANTPAPDPRDPAVKYQGGSFAAAGHLEDEKDV